ncbi:MAG: hypothetical protein WAV09_00725 [Minisyncoccia bacterium]
MDQEKQLQEILELSRENNHLLKGVHRRARWGMFFWILRWAIVIGILFGAYYYVEPFIQSASDTYHRTTDSIRRLQTTGDNITNNRAFQLMVGTSSTSTASTTDVSSEPSVFDRLLQVLGF